jgi:hypothetical protein
LHRTILNSIGVAVVINLLVAIVGIGALLKTSGKPNGMYLGQEGEKA